LTQSAFKYTLGPDSLRHLNLNTKQIRNLKTRYSLGHNTTVDNANLQDVTNFGEDYITQPTALTTMQIVSDSVEDDVGGTGAVEVTIHGLDANWNEKTQVVTMNGTTPVTTDTGAAAIEFLKVNHMNVSGTAPTNAQHTAVGTITLETVTTGAVTYGLIEAGGNMELANRATVPDGFTGYITSWNASVGDLPNTGDEVLILLRGTVDPVERTLLNNIFIFQDVVHLKENSNVTQLNPAFEFPSRTEMKVSAKLIGGVGTVVVSTSFQYWLVPDA